MLPKNPLTFSNEEFKSRLDKVRKGMQAKGVDVMLTTVPENIVYLTGYHSLGYFTYQILVVSHDHPPILLTRALNVEKAQVDSCLEIVEGYKDTEDPNDATYNLLKKYKLLDKRVGNQDDAWFFSVTRYKKLIERLGVKDLIDCSGIVEEVRKIKSAKEIEYIKEAARYAMASIDAAIKSVKPGLMESEMDAEASYALYKAGSEYLGHAHQLVSGPQAGLAFECAGRRPIKKDDVVYMEAGGTHHRYHCMLSRTVLVGNPDPKWLDMAKASRDAVNAARAKIKAGVTSHEVDKAARDLIRKAGYADAFMHRTGYSIGLGFPPDWGEGRFMSINENDQTVLKAGMVFHMIPDLKIAMDGAVVCSDSVVVTETGHELLTPYSQEIVRK
ncbi:MAG: Xaa-Pro peptidase family protein [Alphaproteobacteria bacterium]|nr:Xaa-Pro peptidase family protein [Alphaproteobacteria bacterium]